MENGSGILNSAADPPFTAPPLPPRLLVELEPGARVFLRNLADTFVMRRPPEAKLTSTPAPFWPDVFVSQRLPWGQLLNSMAIHILMVVVLWSLPRVWVLRPQPAPRTVLSKPDVIYFSPDEYLPPLNTGSQAAHRSKKGQPEVARQTIVSLPPESENRSQTIITPPKIKLKQSRPLPNIVAWDRPAPVVPWAATRELRRSQAVPSHLVAPPPVVNEVRDRKVLPVDSAVIAPSPEVGIVSSRLPVKGPQPAVVVPPPNFELGAHARGELHIGHRQVVAPSPELPMKDERLQSVGQSSGGGASPIVPPPPSIPGNGGLSSSPRQLIALSVRPAAGPPPAAVAGNRRGTFAAVPEGKAGAAGTPDIHADGHGSGPRGLDSGKQAIESGARGELPPGILVGPGPRTAPSPEVTSHGRDGGSGASSNSSAQPNSKDPALVADNRPMRVEAADNRPMRVEVTPDRALAAISEPTPLEREVFGNRKLYSMVLNMPNFNSKSGSWVIHFAELKQSRGKASELIAPEATHKVDPGYPLELMRENVQGTVTLYAVIHSDGTVGEVRVVSSPDDRLDAYARHALTRWRFRPALENGNPVPLEVIVMIPFRPGRTF